MACSTCVQARIDHKRRPSSPKLAKEHKRTIRGYFEEVSSHALLTLVKCLESGEAVSSSSYFCAKCRIGGVFYGLLEVKYKLRVADRKDSRAFDWFVRRHGEHPEFRRTKRLAAAFDEAKSIDVARIANGVVAKRHENLRASNGR